MGDSPYIAHRLFNPDLPLSAETGIEAVGGYQLAPGIELSGTLRKSILTNLTDNNRRSNSVYLVSTLIGHFMILQAKVATFTLLPSLTWEILLLVFTHVLTPGSWSLFCWCRWRNSLSQRNHRSVLASIYTMFAKELMKCGLICWITKLL